NMGQGIAEFLVLSGLVTGSVGLFLYPWMPRAAPWGFALPFVFVAGLVLLERRRQRAMVAAGGDADLMAAAAARSDWSVFLWAYGCALAGVAAFVVGYTAPPQWVPPPGTISSCVGPTC